MDSYTRWRAPAAPHHLLPAAASRLLLAAALAGLLWLPGSDTGAMSERRWAQACLSVLMLLALAIFPAGERLVTGHLDIRARPWAALVLAVAVAGVVTLTGGGASPYAFLFLLPALSLDTELGAMGVALVAALVLLCSLVADAIALHASPVSLQAGGVVMAAERSCMVTALGAAVLTVRIGQARRLEHARRLRALTSEWQAGMQALERARGEMVACVSHELMTPLAAIRAGAGVLAEVAPVPGSSVPIPLSGHHRRLALNVQRNATRLALLVDDLLELARLENDAARLRLAWHRCDALLWRTVESVALLCEGRRQRVEWQVTPSELAVWGDCRRVEQVLVNLLANAHKYAGEGAQIVLHAQRDGRGVRLEVCDDGPGLPTESIAQVFDRYYRCPGSPGQGSGLGLALAQAQVELHHGRIWAENGQETGCRFVCWFPDPDVTAGEQAYGEES